MYLLCFLCPVAEEIEEIEEEKVSSFLFSQIKLTIKLQ